MKPERVPSYWRMIVEMDTEGGAFVPVVRVEPEDLVFQIGDTLYEIEKLVIEAKADEPRIIRFELKERVDEDTERAPGPIRRIREPAPHPSTQ